MAEAKGKIVKLQASDGPIFEVEEELAKMSAALRQMLEDIPSDEESPIPLPNVRGEVLQKVFDYCEHHRGAAGGAAEAERPRGEERMDEWDQEFVAMDISLLFEVILAASYLDIADLFTVTCKAVANIIKDKTPEEIRTTFKIKNDFTPEEEEQVRKENEWAEEK